MPRYILNIVLVAAMALRPVTFAHAQTLKATLRGHSDHVWGVAFSPDGKILASASFDKTIKLWDSKTRKLITTLTAHNGPVVAICFSPDGKLLASASFDKTVRVWDVGSKKEKYLLKGHTDKVHSMCFSPDGKLLASGGGLIRLWDVKTGEWVGSLGKAETTITSLTFSRSGRTLVSGGFGEITTWNMTTRKQSGRTRGTQSGRADGSIPCFSSVSLTPDGKTFASAASLLDLTHNYTASEIVLRECMSGKIRSVLVDRKYAVSSTYFTPDGKTLVASYGRYYRDKEQNRSGGIRLWNVFTGKPRAIIASPKRIPNCVCVSPNGKTLVAGLSDGTIKFWDISKFEE